MERADGRWMGRDQGRDQGWEQGWEQGRVKGMAQRAHPPSSSIPMDGRFPCEPPPSIPPPPSVTALGHPSSTFTGASSSSPFRPPSRSPSAHKPEAASVHWQEMGMWPRSVIRAQ